jgi:hypothetical protein
MNSPTETNEFEALKKYGAKWAVLAAMTANMDRKGMKLPGSVFESLQTTRSKLVSGCFSLCEIACDLSRIEGPLFSQGHSLDEREFQKWSDLLAEAMQGSLDYHRILGIPALDPIKNDCGFLACSCSS